MFTLCNYVEHEFTVEIITFFKLPFFDGKSCEEWRKMTSKKI